MAGTPSVLGGASSKPSVRERCERASEAAESTVALREVGTGGSLAGKEGVTVRWEVDVVEAAGLADAAGLAVVVVVLVVAAAFAGVAHAARRAEDEKPRWDIL